MAVSDVSRRQVLQTAAAVGVVGAAGCGGGDGGDGSDGGGGSGDASVPPEDYPSIDEWLTETAIGGADDTYAGSLTDHRDNASLTVDVGAEGNDGNFAYAPSAVVVSTGTEVRWNWTGEGNPHNVEALPEEQLGESDYEFSSGEAVGGSGVKYTRTLEESGVALYHCEPHLSLGMKGGIAVE
ncbi:halocyanin domain-containing protein [Haloarcula nitratireducens]|uniref:Halocyanin domain-containing protein n=1 Tax=Haloarcula nitratireducens TaxID=2487749 RepID=A0AAW4PCR5_9EURY|nr:halocyanin domain-containing protein [Halomicroarcula nitratireducens]MBX0295696.1 halocyanin domain-containing protein [Halomicroarcula nitratireducens]